MKIFLSLLAFVLGLALATPSFAAKSPTAPMGMLANPAAHAEIAPAAPASTTPAPTVSNSTYTIIAGDVLQVTVWKEEGMDREVLVLPDGSITFPLIGTFNVQGQSPAEVEGIIKDKLTKFIPNASVTVAIKAALGHTVSVIGQVAKPGEFVISHRMTAMQALSQAGGLTPDASEHSIIVLRHNGGNEISIPIPYSDLVDGDHLDKDIDLQPGDVIVVPTSSLL